MKQAARILRHGEAAPEAKKLTYPTKNTVEGSARPCPTKAVKFGIC